MWLFGPPDIRKLTMHRDLRGLMKALSYKTPSADDASVDIRKGAAEALGGMRDAAAIVSLIDSMKMDCPAVARAAAQALGYIKDPSAIDALAACLESGTRGVGGAAASALRRFDHPRAAEALQNSSFTGTEAPRPAVGEPKAPPAEGAPALAPVDAERSDPSTGGGRAEPALAPYRALRGSRGPNALLQGDSREEPKSSPSCLAVISRAALVVAGAWFLFGIKTGTTISLEYWHFPLFSALAGGLAFEVFRAFIRAKESRRTQRLARAAPGVAFSRLALALLLVLAIERVIPLVVDHAQAAALGGEAVAGTVGPSFWSSSTFALMLFGVEAALIMLACAYLYRGLAALGNSPDRALGDRPGPGMPLHLLPAVIAGALVYPIATGLLGDYEAMKFRHQIVSREGSGETHAAEVLGESRDPRAVPQLIVALASGEASRGSEAAEALGKIGDERAAAPLVQALGNSGPEVQAAAARALGQLNSGSASKKLCELLESESAIVREAAVEALRRIGRPAAIHLLAVISSDNPEAKKCAEQAIAPVLEREGVDVLVEALIARGPAAGVAVELLSRRGDEAVARLTELLAHRSEGVRIDAAKVLGMTESAAAVEPLATALAKDRSERVVVAAATALGRLGDAEATKKLTEILSSKNGSVKCAIVDALGETGSEEAVPLLQGLFLDRDMRVRQRTAAALGRIKGPAARRALIAEIERHGVAKEAADGLAGMGSEAVDDLLPLLASEKGHVWRAAARALGKIGDARAIGPLIAMFSRQEVNDDVPAKALIEIGRQAVPRLVALLEDPDAPQSVHLTVMATLGHIGDPEVAPAIARNLSHQVWAVQRESRDALVLLGEGAVPALGEAMRHDKPKVRRLAAEALLTIGSPQAKPYCIAGLSDEDGVVREHCAAALGKIGATEATDALIRVLSDEDDDVAEAAANSLGAFKAASAIEALAASMSHKDSAVRRAAGAALLGLGELGYVRLSDLLREGDAKAKDGAAFALRGSKEPRTVPLLVDALRDPEVRADAADALERLDWKPESPSDRVHLLIAKERWQELKAAVDVPVDEMRPLLKDADRGVRSNVASLMGRLGDTESTAALIEMLRSEERWPGRLAAAGALASIGGEGAMEALIAALLDENRNVRRGVVQGLREMDWSPRTSEEKVRFLIATSDSKGVVALGSEAVEPLIALLNEKDVRIQLQVMTVLGDIGDARAMGPMEERLRNSNGFVSRRASVEIRKLGWVPEDTADKMWFLIAAGEWDKIGKLGNDAADTLIEALRSEDPEVRAGAASTLGVVGDIKAVESLIALLEDRYYSVLTGVAGALARFKDPRAVKGLVQRVAVDNGDASKAVTAALVSIGEPAAAELVRAFSDESSAIRAGAARVLVEIGVRAAPHLISALESEDAAVRKRAAWALAEISGEVFYGEDAVKWREWLARNPTATN